MKKKAEPFESKPVENLYKDSFKIKLVQQLEAKEITKKDIALKYGIGKVVITENVTAYE